MSKILHAYGFTESGAQVTPVKVVLAADYEEAIAALRDLLHNNGSLSANNKARELVGFRK